MVVRACVGYEGQGWWDNRGWKRGEEYRFCVAGFVLAARDYGLVPRRSLAEGLSPRTSRNIADLLFIPVKPLFHRHTQFLVNKPKSQHLLHKIRCPCRIRERNYTEHFIWK
jgi:hypothetical protein